MIKREKYKFHFLSINKSGLKKKTINSTDISTGYMDYEITMEDFIKAIITCGMPMYYLTPTITRSRLNEINYKMYALFTLIEFDSTSKYIKLRKEIKYLDASEKATLSYYLGMVLTKYISYKEYGQDYLVHLNIMEKNNTIKFYNIDKKLCPDLIGYCIKNGKFSVFEAKGRIRKTTAAIEKALEQVQNINYIAGSKPVYGVAQMSYFNNGELYVVAIDPVDEGEKEIELLKNGLNQYISLYYKPVIELFDEGNEIIFDNEKICSIYRYDKLQFMIEIPIRLYNALKEREFNIELLRKKCDFVGDGINISIIEGDN